MRKTVFLGLLAASTLSFGVAQETGGGQTGGGQTGGAATEPGVAAQSQTESGIMVVEARNPGSYIADGEGKTLYTLVDENGEVLPCNAECLTAWPPFTGEASLGADSTLDASLIGTVDAEDGSAQVTYNDYPLYYYAQDVQPGDLSGQGLEGFDGVWYIIGDNGEPLESDPLLETGE